MSKLEKAKEIIEANVQYAKSGLFNSRNLVGDPMTTIYEDDGLTIDICYDYSYFEVFGLDFMDYLKLEKFYKKLVNRKDCRRR